MAAAATPVGRERGWGPMVLALATCLAVAAAPFWPPAAGLAAALVRSLVPVEQMLLLVVPALAACAAVAWYAGGRLAPALLWSLLAAWVLGQPLPAESPGYAAVARGWALALAAAFGVVCFVRPRLPFFVRALSAIGMATTIALLWLLVSGRDPARLADVMGTELARRSQASLDASAAHLRTDGVWRSVSERAPEIASRATASAGGESPVCRGATAPVVPALLALESLAALGLAWGLHHRLSRVRLGPPLGSLSTFRFSDQLVWGLVAGVTIVILPSLAPLRAVGFNLLLFFGALYALRGLGILRWLASERVALAAVVGLALLLPIVGLELLAGLLSGLALAVGLGDTWGDWRNRRARQVS